MSSKMERLAMAKKLTTLCKSAEITGYQLAKLLDRPLSTIYTWTRTPRTIPINEARRIAAILGITADQLIKELLGD